ncbi:MAG: PIN domain nuclease [Micropepsaceae bacterium]
MFALVDTTVLIDFVRGRPTDQVRKLDLLIDAGGVVVGDLILCEFLRGFDTEADARRVQQTLSRFASVELCGADIAVEAAANYRRLRALGITVRKTVDLIVGTYCIQHALPLLHNDRDYDPMAKHLGLRVL